MAKKNKLTLASVQKTVGVGKLVEKTIKFVDADGEEFEGEVLIKRLSHNDKVKAVEVWELEDKRKLTIDQVNNAILFKSVYSANEEPFFPTIEDTGTVPTEILQALNSVVDEVNYFSGKKLTSEQKSSGVNSLSTESVEEQSKKPNTE